jgi:hypothetical protein
MKLRILAAICLVSLGQNISHAQTSPGEPSGGAVAATVGDEEILVSQAQRLVAKITAGKKTNPQALPFMQAQALEELVSRRLVLAYAARTGAAATAEEIAAEKEKFSSQLADRHEATEKRTGPICAKHPEGRSGKLDLSPFPADLRRQFAWNVVWAKYAARYVTLERRQTYFSAHQRELDGTRLVVSHILLRQASPGEDLFKQADAMRSDIRGGKLSFADAARKYSGGPSRDQGGRLGPIGRHGPMDEAFSRAAFRLAPGEISPPVKTPFGVHLIRCDEVRPGDKRLGDVTREVDDALERELLDKLAQLQRRHTAVKYTGRWPHFKPGTHELATP